MKVIKLETFLTNAGLRNYLFIRLHTDTGLTGIGEASLEWQEQTVQTLIHEFLEERYVLGANPFDIEDLITRMVRDQYQGGSTIMTAISGIEIALWDLVGKACGQPVYNLLGGRCHERLPAYANGWYGGAYTPQQYADRAKEVVSRGYTALKFDPFGVAWKELPRVDRKQVMKIVEAVRQAVGENVDLLIEGHGRFSVETAVEIARDLEPYHPTWFEEPVTPDSIDLLYEVKSHVKIPLAAGERLYTVSDFYRLISKRAADVVQMDVAHCGGILTSKKIAAMAAVQDIRISPHCSIGPVALAAALHVDIGTPNFMIQEAYGEFDVPWRDALVRGWNPLQQGYFYLPESPGLGVDIDENIIAAHPYVKNAFPSLWDRSWFEKFTQNQKNH
ncbi:MAG TPA: mandelate racemase/muconate lactonizing enzyme family protein [Candidatus Limnocylindrales bacterium]|nr:mandelate racemase/muconate lactonizing enzyme family protein [Candidatus Limnocylindrales bacterium]